MIKPKITIERSYLPNCTIGHGSISISGMELMSFKTLELANLGNVRRISCIPEGVYKYRRYESPKHGSVLLLEDVPNRSYIEVHIGNFTRDILGCILTGDSHKDLDNDGIMDVKNSKKTHDKLMSLAGFNGIIEIK